MYNANNLFDYPDANDLYADDLVVENENGYSFLNSDSTNSVFGNARLFCTCRIGIISMFTGQSHSGFHVWFGHGFMFGVHVQTLPRPLFELVCRHDFAVIGE